MRANKRGERTNTISSLLKGDFLINKNSQKNFPFILFIVILLLINISISFNAERLIIKTISLEKEAHHLRVVYITTKSELMGLYKRSVVEEIVEPLGLRSTTSPPSIISKNEE